MYGISVKVLTTVGLFLYLIVALYMVKSDLVNTEAQLETEKSNVSRLNIIIDMQKGSISELSDTIDVMNAKYKKHEAGYTKAKNELKKWRDAKPEVKYINITKMVKGPTSNKLSDVCEYGLRLNRKIAELEYEKL